MPDPIRMAPRVVGGPVTQTPHTVDESAHAEAPVRTGWTTTVAPVDLDQLADVDTAGETQGDVLTYDGARWAPHAPPALTGFATHTELATHIAAATPHPAYDDLPSLTLLFANGLV